MGCLTPLGQRLIEDKTLPVISNFDDSAKPQTASADKRTHKRLPKLRKLSNTHTMVNMEGGTAGSGPPPAWMTPALKQFTGQVGPIVTVVSVFVG